MGSKSKSKNNATKNPPAEAPEPIETPVEETLQAEAEPTEGPEPTVYPWGGKYEHCIECKGTDRKHYSGGQCTRCYTIKRNARLVAEGKIKPSTAKRDRLEKRVAKLTAQLDQARAELDEVKKLGEVAESKAS